MKPWIQATWLSARVTVSAFSHLFPHCFLVRTIKPSHAVKKMFLLLCLVRGEVDYDLGDACACLYLHVLSLLPWAPVRGPNRINALICECVYVCVRTRVYLIVWVFPAVPDLSQRLLLQMILWSSCRVGCESGWCCVTARLLLLMKPPAAGFVQRDLQTPMQKLNGFRQMYFELRILDWTWFVWKFVFSRFIYRAAPWYSIYLKSFSFGGILDCSIIVFLKTWKRNVYFWVLMKIIWLILIWLSNASLLFRFISTLFHPPWKSPSRFRFATIFQNMACLLPTPSPCFYGPKSCSIPISWYILCTDCKIKSWGLVSWPQL